MKWNILQRILNFVIGQWYNKNIESAKKVELDAKHVYSKVQHKGKYIKEMMLIMKPSMMTIEHVLPKN